MVYLLAAGSCQTILGIEDLPPADATLADATLADAALADATLADAALADAMPLGPFGQATALSINQPDNIDDAPTLRPDMREMYFSSFRSSNGIFVATRATTGENWGNVTRIKAFDILQKLGNPELSRDGLTLWLSGSLGPNESAVFKSTRSALNQAWSTPQKVDALSEPETTITPSTPAIDGLVMIVASNRPGPDGDYNLYQTKRMDTQSPWGPLVALDDLNTLVEEHSPFLEPDGRTLWWSSNRSSGKYELYRSTRATIEDEFTEVVPVVELNGAMFRLGAPWVSDDRRHIFFLGTGANEPTSEHFDIYHATR